MAIAENTGRLDGFDTLGGFGTLGYSGPVDIGHWSEVTVISTFQKYPNLIRGLLILLTLYVIVSYATRNPPAVELLSAEISPAFVMQGDPVQAKFVVNRNEICPNTIISWWQDEAGEASQIKLPLRSRTIMQVGKNLPVFVNLTAPSKAGRMCYRSTVIHRCEGGTTVVDTPALCVLVAERTPP